ncbi:hypothetical protein [Asanoa sp. NPDC050611]|uniref:hypothetical protein n=1 Tax=Asanoa sp. NPDC050611 TaxID=3157098 RepID=UPI0033DF9B83
MSDKLDDLINGAIGEFDAVERSAQTPAPGVQAVRHTVAVRRRVRFTAASVVGALLIAVPITAYAVGPRGNNSPPTATQPASPSPSVSHSVSPTPTLAPSSPPARPVDVRDATLQLPAFPGFEEGCKAEGKRTFVDGTVKTADGATLTIGSLTPIRANLDGVPGDEALTTLRCDTDGSVHVTQLLALKVAPDGALTPLGYVVNSPDTDNVTATFSRANITVEDGVVRLTVYGAYQTDGWPPCDRQVRGFALQDGAFRQVDGPTQFQKPSADFHKIDFRNAGILMARNNPDGSGQVKCVPLVDGAAEIDIDEAGKGTTRYTVTIGKVSFVEAADGEATFAILTLRSASGETTQTLQSFQRDGDYPLGHEILRSGTGGVSRIEKADVNDGLVRVTVKTSSGDKVWSYRPSATNQSWERVN